MANLITAIIIAVVGSEALTDVDGDSITVSKQGRRVHLGINKTYTISQQQATGAGIVIATLPTGYRPAKAFSQLIIANNITGDAQQWGIMTCSGLPLGGITLAGPRTYDGTVWYGSFHVAFSLDFDTAS